MAYNLLLADRIRLTLSSRKDLEEKAMFGGIAFMVDGKMCVGILQEDLMIRIDPARREEVLARPGCRDMEFTGRPMAGYFLISPEGTGTEPDLTRWIDLALEFNPKAIKSGKRK